MIVQDRVIHVSYGVNGTISDRYAMIGAVDDVVSKGKELGARWAVVPEGDLFSLYDLGTVEKLGNIGWSISDPRQQFKDRDSAEATALLLSS